MKLRHELRIVTQAGDVNVSDVEEYVVGFYYIHIRKHSGESLTVSRTGVENMFHRVGNSDRWKSAT